VNAKKLESTPAFLLALFHQNYGEVLEDSGHGEIW